MIRKRVIVEHYFFPNCTFRLEVKYGWTTEDYYVYGGGERKCVDYIWHWMDSFHSTKPLNGYNLFVGKRLRRRREQESGGTLGKPSLLGLGQVSPNVNSFSSFQMVKSAKYSDYNLNS